MRFQRCYLLAVPLAFALIAGAQSTPALRMSDAEMEEFLRDASMGPRRVIPIGITNTERATLTKGDIKHDCHIQTVDISKTQYTTDRGTEINFRDTYKFNIAAYRLDRMLGMHMIPVSVERKVGGKAAAVTWWVDDVIMMELDRWKKKIQPPDLEAWNNQMYCARVFDELVYDTDPNVGNFLIDKNWKLWLVDKSRAFRLRTDLREPKNLVKCDRGLLEALRKLDEVSLMQEMKGYLTKGEIKALLARRDKIVKFFDGEVAKKGAAAVLVDLPKGQAQP
jgi:hypothetical protein